MVKAFFQATTGNHTYSANPPNFIRSSAVTNSYQKTSLKQGHFNTAEAEGFEPPVSCPTMVFKTIALNHSATLPLSNFNLFRAKNHHREITGDAGLLFSLYFSCVF